MGYEVSHDGVSDWRKCQVRARVIPSSAAGTAAGPPLKKNFDVTDCAGGSWVSAKKLTISDQLALDRGAVGFKVQPSPTLTAEDLVQSQGQYAVQVICYLDLPGALTALPGMGIPVPLDTPVAAPCPLKLVLPAAIETKMQQVLDDEAVLVFARVVFPIPAGQDLVESALGSLRVRAESSRLVVAPQAQRDGWKIVRVSLKPGETEPPRASDLGLVISAQVGYQVVPEKRVLVPFAQEGKLQVQCQPQVLTVDGQDSVTVYADPIFRSPATPDQMMAVLKGLQLSFDSAASSWLVPGPPQLSSDRASWSVSGKAPEQQPAGSLPATASVTVSGQFGLESVSQMETLRLEPDTEFELCASLDGHDEAQIFFKKESAPGSWEFTDITLSLRKPGQTAQGKARFSCTAPVLTDPFNILKFETVRASDQPSWTVKVSLRDGTDLDVNPGTEWLETSGLIEVAARVEQDGGDRKAFDGKVTYRLRPRLELVLCDAAGEPDDPEGHTYEAAGIDFAPLEFAADGVDALGVNVWVCRTDIRSDDWLRDDRSSYVTLSEPRFSGPSDDDFCCKVVPPDPARRGPVLLHIQSRKPCLYTTVRAKRQALILPLKASLKPDAPPNYLRENLSLDGRLNPRYVYLKLWVVPGKKRGTSVAGVYAGLPKPGQGKLEPLLNANVELNVVSREGLLGLGDDAMKLVDSEGRQSWELVYKGLSRTNLGSEIKVRCRLKDADQAVFFKINVKQNGAELFAALNEASDSLQLTNPEWEGASTPMAAESPKWDRTGSGAYWVDAIIPDKCRGPVYNLRNCFGPPFLKGAPPREWSTWLCGEYSERIINWLLSRRHGKQDPQTALRMNGLEVSQYAVAGVHDWCGVHLSGVGASDDPIFIDPWWTQTWGEESVGYGWHQQEIRLIFAHAYVLSPHLALIVRALLIRAGIKILPQALFKLKEHVRALIATLLSGQAPETTGTVIKVLGVSGGTTAGAYLYQYFCIGPVCRPDCFDLNLNYTTHPEQELLRRLADSFESSAGGPDGLSECEVWS
jgi:hypothetical protein